MSCTHSEGYNTLYMSCIHYAGYNTHNICRVFIPPDTTYIMHVEYIFRQTQHTQYMSGIHSGRHNIHNACREFIPHVGYSFRQA